MCRRGWYHLYYKLEDELFTTFIEDGLFTTNSPKMVARYLHEKQKVCSSLFIRGIQDQLHNHLSKMQKKGFSSLAGTVPLTWIVYHFWQYAWDSLSLIQIQHVNSWGKKRIFCVGNCDLSPRFAINSHYNNVNIISDINAYILESTILLVLQRWEERLHITWLWTEINLLLMTDYQQLIKMGSTFLFQFLRKSSKS